MKIQFRLAGKFHSWLIGMVAVGIVILGLFFSTHRATLPSVPIPTINGDVSFHTISSSLSANAIYDQDGKIIHYIDEPTTLERLWTEDNHHILVGVTGKFAVQGTIHPYDLLLGKDHFSSCEGNPKRVNDFWFYVYKADRSESTTGFDKSRFGISPCAAWKNMFPAYPSTIESMVNIAQGDLLYIALSPTEHDGFITRNEEPRIEFIPPCGNGRPDASEQCDDGNTAVADGCNAQCSVEQGFACNGSPSVCTRLCGNGVREGYEVCDDGNTVNGDGCSSCAVDPEWYCTGQPSVCRKPCGDGVCNMLTDGENSIDCREDCTDPTYSFAPSSSMPWVRQAGGRGSNPNCGKPGTNNCVHSLRAHSYGYAVSFRPYTNPGPQRWGYYNGKLRYVYPSFEGNELTANYFESGPPYTWMKPFYKYAGDHSATLSVIERNYPNGTTGMYTDTVLDSLIVPYTVVEPPSAVRLQFTVSLRNAGAEDEHIEVTGTIQNFDPNSEQLSRDDASSAPKKLFPDTMQNKGNFMFKIWKQAPNVVAQDDLVFAYDLMQDPCPVDLILHGAYKPALQGQTLAYKKVCVVQQ